MTTTLTRQTPRRSTSIKLARTLATRAARRTEKQLIPFIAQEICDRAALDFAPLPDEAIETLAREEMDRRGWEMVCGFGRKF